MYFLRCRLYNNYQMSNIQANGWKGKAGLSYKKTCTVQQQLDKSKESRQKFGPKGQTDDQKHKEKTCWKALAI